MIYLFQFLDLMCRYLVTEAAYLQKFWRCLKEQWREQTNETSFGIFVGKIDQNIIKLIICFSL